MTLIMLYEYAGQSHAIDYDSFKPIPYANKISLKFLIYFSSNQLMISLLHVYFKGNVI